MPIQRVISHSHEESFAIFHRQSSAADNKTIALTFDVTSPSPTNKQIIPYTLHTIVPYAPSQALFSFVGITSNWAVVSFGEQAFPLRAEGTSSNKISAEAVSHKRTLFQDIFGVSAFDHAASRPIQISTAVLPRSKAPVSAFDDPSHLLPPMSNIFETIMEEFIHETPTSASTAQAIDVDEDVDMEVDAAELVPAPKHTTRHIGQQEMGVLVNLFKSHTIGCMYHRSTAGPFIEVFLSDKYSTPTLNTSGKVNMQPKATANGKVCHSPSGPSTPKTNGSLTLKSTGVKPPPSAITTASIPSPAPPETGSHQGKKRKKPQS
jgi:NET1-associated nuclear protein 1 (U3 small nucleolar RNA-associated protein 17)